MYIVETHDFMLNHMFILCCRRCWQKGFVKHFATQLIKVGPLVRLRQDASCISQLPGHWIMQTLIRIQQDKARHHAGSVQMMNHRTNRLNQHS